MKKSVIFVALAFILAILPSCESKKNTVEKIKIGLAENNDPYCYYSDDAQADGFYVDALNHITSFAEMEAQYVACPYEELAEKLKNGEIDCFAAKNYSESNDYLKSDAFFYSGASALIPEKGQISYAKSKNDLKSARVCALEHNCEQKAFSLANVTQLSSLAEVKDCLEKEEYDVFIGDNLTAKALRTMFVDMPTLHTFPETQLQSEDNCHCLYFKSDNVRLQEKLNDAISKFTLNDAAITAEEALEYVKNKNFQKTVEK